MPSLVALDGLGSTKVMGNNVCKSLSISLFFSAGVGNIQRKMQGPS